MTEDKITGELIKQLFEEAKHVTSLFTTLSSVQSDETMNPIRYYLKWLDVTGIAINNLDVSTMSLEDKRLLTADLVLLITTPLNGLLTAFDAVAKENDITLPKRGETPKDTIAFKQWAVDWILRALEEFRKNEEKNKSKEKPKEGVKNEN